MTPRAKRHPRAPETRRIYPRRLEEPVVNPALGYVQDDRQEDHEPKDHKCEVRAISPPDPHEQRPMIHEGAQKSCLEKVRKNAAR